MSDQSKKSGQKNSLATDSVIFLLGSEGGQKHFAWRDGQQGEKSGPEVVRASHTHQRERDSEMPTSETCGQSSFDSSGSAALQQLLESRLHLPTLSDDQQKKTCKKCLTSKPLPEFYTSKSGRTRSCCRICDNRRTQSKRRKDYPQKRITERGKILVAAARYRANKMGLPFDLDVESIQKKIDMGTCELTGIPFDLKASKAWNTPSLDRIKPGNGYTKQNVRVVLYAVNVMAHTWGPNKIIEIAEAIKEERKALSNDLSERIGQRLMENLKESGAIEYELTWSRLATPSGRVLYRQRASVRRISDSDCSGWGTPTATNKVRSKKFQDGRQLTPVEALAGWGTPRVSDGTLAESTTIPPSGTRSRLELEVLTAGWNTPTCPSITGTHQSGSNRFTKSIREAVSGPTTNGSNVETENRGALNPDFSRWLMGFPPEWSSCADMAMQSFRK